MHFSHTIIQRRHAPASVMVLLHANLPWGLEVESHLIAVMLLRRLLFFRPSAGENTDSRRPACLQASARL